MAATVWTDRCKIRKAYSFSVSSHLPRLWNLHTPQGRKVPPLGRGGRFSETLSRGDPLEITVKELLHALENINANEITNVQSVKLHDACDSLRITIETLWARWDDMANKPRYTTL